MLPFPAPTKAMAYATNEDDTEKLVQSSTENLQEGFRTF